jgi:hypothetical protein
MTLQGAHAVVDEVERAYRRGDALLKRRALIHEWVRCVVGWLVKLRDSDSYRCAKVPWS